LRFEFEVSGLWFEVVKNQKPETKNLKPKTLNLKPININR